MSDVCAVGGGDVVSFLYLISIFSVHVCVNPCWRHSSLMLITLLFKLYILRPLFCVLQGLCVQFEWDLCIIKLGKNFFCCD